MYVEIRKKGKNKKYYLIHAYRIGSKIKKITRYLGPNLTKKRLEILKKRAACLIIEQIKEKTILEVELSQEEIEAYKNYENKIEISHLKKYDWEKFTALFTYNTNAIEGSSVAFSGVRDLLNKKEKPQNLDEIESIDVARALEYMKKTNEKVTMGLIKKFHYLCFKRTKHFAGKLRGVDVVIKDNKGNVVHRGAQLKDMVKLLEELCQWYNKHKNKYPPLLLAAVVHNQFENIHPFQDGNGRVGRILLNYILKKHKYPLINIRLKDRAYYYKTLMQFQGRNNIKPTIKFLIKQYKIQYRGIK